MNTHNIPTASRRRRVTLHLGVAALAPQLSQASRSLSHAHLPAHQETTQAPFKGPRSAPADGFRTGFSFR